MRHRKTINSCFPDMVEKSPRLPIKRALKTFVVPMFSLKTVSNSQGPEAQIICFILKFPERNTITLVFGHGNKMFLICRQYSYEHSSKIIFCCSKLAVLNNR